MQPRKLQLELTIIVLVLSICRLTQFASEPHDAASEGASGVRRFIDPLSQYSYKQFESKVVLDPSHCHSMCTARVVSNYASNAATMLNKQAVVAAASDVFNSSGLYIAAGTQVRLSSTMMGSQSPP